MAQSACGLVLVTYCDGDRTIAYIGNIIAAGRCGCSTQHGDVYRPSQSETGPSPPREGGGGTALAKSRGTTCVKTYADRS